MSHSLLPNRDGIPSAIPLSVFDLQEIQVASWNGRGILMSNFEDRDTMRQHIIRLSKMSHVLCLQECHGSPRDAFLTFGQWLPGWEIRYSCCFNSDGTCNSIAGGVLTAICPGLCGVANFAEHVLVPGRALCVSLFCRNRSFDVLNVHNHNLSAQEVRSISQFTNTLSLNIRSDPCSRMAVLTGDLNIKAEGEMTFKIGQVFAGGQPNIGSSNPIFRGQRLRQWKNILAGWVEIVQPLPTHFDSGTSSCSRIDRAWVLGPSDMLIKMHIRSFVSGVPENYHGLGVSDHAPMLVCFGRKPKFEASNSIPKFVCKHPNFKMHVDKCSEYIDVLSFSDHEQLAILKKCFKVASLKVLQDIRDNEDSVESQRLVFASMSRALWFNNVVLAKKLLQSSTIAMQHLTIVNNRVCLFNAHYFATCFDEIHNKFYTDQIRAMNRQSQALGVSSNLKKQLKSRMQCYRRLCGVYWPTNKFMKVTGVRIECENPSDSNASNSHPTTVSSPDDIQDALKNYWTPVYALKEIDRDVAQKFLKVYARRNRHLFEFHSIEEIEQEDIANTIKFSKHSACGPDGCGYAVYKANIALSSQVLHNAYRDLSKEQPRTDLEEFNMQKGWFAPKGALDSDKVAVVRTANNLRTIFGSNCDSKIIAGTVGFKMTPATLRVTPINQRGFCKGRQISLNIVDLDLFIRVFNNEFDVSSLSFDHIEDIPVSVLYDFCNAFPTLVHEYLFLVLIMYELPGKFRNVIISLYTRISVFSSGIGNGKFLFYVLCGVKTGCPLSSILFLLCVNPIIDLFRFLSDSPGFSTTRVCADDFGSALKSLYRIKCQASIFKLAGKVAGLFLKPSKCVIIVSCTELSDELEAAIKLWLSINVPEFVDFSIASSGKYLGYYLGRDSEHRSFDAPFEKVEQRVLEIVDANAPVTSCIIRYNQRVVPVLSYVSQFAFPPASFELVSKEMWCVHKLLRMPGKCMSRKLCNSIDFCTEVNPIPLSASCCANMIRFAHSERDYLIELHSNLCEQQLASARNDPRPLASIDAPANVDNLMNVPNGGISETPILVTLLHAIHLSGPFASFKENCRIDPSRNWLPDYPTTPFPQKFKSLQSASLDAFSSEFKVSSLSAELHEKVKVTFMPLAPFNIQINWFSELQNVLSKETPYIKTCWLRSIVGAWCTSTRCKQIQGRPCIFGCVDGSDKISHYLECSILWQFARSSLKVNEQSVQFLSRLCVSDPSSDKLKLLAFSHALYHVCVNDTSCMKSNGMPRSCQIVQHEASQACNYCLHMIRNK